ncbi:MAG: peptidase [Candidatus Angelobacter sp.]|jgi:membrane-associated protease RseP (regulator of RpoE activity)|nr:peptidase [Candidatus Angelobacter sp.]
MNYGGSSFTFTQSQPPPREVFITHPPNRRYWLHALLFLLTVLTTLIIGARLQDNFLNGQPTFIADESFFPIRWIWAQPSRLLLGIPFSATLLGILMAHEMGHFVYSVRNRVYATLPFFIPAPTPIGTMGAFIQIKSAFRTRASLFDIGIAGPIAGFLIAVPMAAVGLILSRPLPAEIDPATVQLGQPLIFEFIYWLLHQFSIGNAAQIPMGSLYMHPIALAAWVGMLATAFNLLPGGQLDGGHIVYAMNPRAHKPVSTAAMLVLAPLAFFYWPGWLFWVIGIGLTRRHPPVPIWPDLNVQRRYLALMAALIFLLTFVPEPFPGSSLYEILRQSMHLQ